MSLRRLAKHLLLALCALSVACAAPAEGPDVMAELPAARPAEVYRLGPGDQIKITVFNELELTGDYIVGPQGAVSLPLVGEVNAQGLSVTELARDLTTALGRYIRDPSVAVQVLAYRPFFILGEVNEAGTYPYTVDLTVMAAVATAGGFSYRADRRRVFIKRAGDAVEREYRLDAETKVQPGDTIRITERFF
jgi:polysaccharide export outer membrane protein